MQGRPEKEKEIISSLYKESEEFRKLWDEHEELEKRLSELENQRFLTPGEEMEVKRIKKRKLLGKDRIEELIRGRKVGLPG
jgi:uncharacterized protein YdcH (DUF465 family)